jgi:hypothetical protein
VHETAYMYMFKHVHRKYIRIDTDIALERERERVRYTIYVGDAHTNERWNVNLKYKARFSASSRDNGQPRFTLPRISTVYKHVPSSSSEKYALRTVEGDIPSRTGDALTA